MNPRGFLVSRRDTSFEPRRTPLFKARARGWLRRPQRTEKKEREREKENRRERGRGKEEPGARKTNGEGGHLRKTEERHHLIPSSYLCISQEGIGVCRCVLWKRTRAHLGEIGGGEKGKRDTGGQFRDALMGSP